jgi:hypothetical protein
MCEEKVGAEKECRNGVGSRFSKDSECYCIGR